MTLLPHRIKTDVTELNASKVEAAQYSKGGALLAAEHLANGTTGRGQIVLQQNATFSGSTKTADLEVVGTVVADDAQFTTAEIATLTPGVIVNATGVTVETGPSAGYLDSKLQVGSNVVPTGSGLDVTIAAGTYIAPDHFGGGGGGSGNGANVAIAAGSGIAGGAVTITAGTSNGDPAEGISPTTGANVNLTPGSGNFIGTPGNVQVTQGNLVVEAGFVSAAGSVSAAKGFISTTTPSLNWGVDHTGSGTVSLASAATYDLATGSGLVVLHSDTDGLGAVYFCYAGTVVKLGGDTTYVAGAPAAGQVGLFYNGGTTKYRITNSKATTQAMYISLIRTRPAS